MMNSAINYQIIKHNLKLQKVMLLFRKHANVRDTCHTTCIVNKIIEKRQNCK